MERLAYDVISRKPLVAKQPDPLCARHDVRHGAQNGIPTGGRDKTRAQKERVFTRLPTRMLNVPRALCFSGIKRTHYGLYGADHIGNRRIWAQINMAYSSALMGQWNLWRILGTFAIGRIIGQNAQLCKDRPNAIMWCPCLGGQTPDLFGSFWDEKCRLHDPHLLWDVFSFSFSYCMTMMQPFFLLHFHAPLHTQTPHPRHSHSPHKGRRMLLCLYVLPGWSRFVHSVQDD